MKFRRPCSARRKKAIRLEQGLFIEIRDFLSAQIPRIQHTAVGLKTLDALVSLAVAAVKNRYVRPEIADDGVIDIVVWPSSCRRSRYARRRSVCAKQHAARRRG